MATVVAVEGMEMAEREMDTVGEAEERDREWLSDSTSSFGLRRSEISTLDVLEWKGGE